MLGLLIGFINMAVMCYWILVGDKAWAIGCYVVSQIAFLSAVVL